jgi:hypothetical protein
MSNQFAYIVHVAISTKVFENVKFRFTYVRIEDNIYPQYRKSVCGVTAGEATS